MPCVQKTVIILIHDNILVKSTISDKKKFVDKWNMSLTTAFHSAIFIICVEHIIRHIGSSIGSPRSMVA